MKITKLLLSLLVLLLLSLKSYADDSLRSGYYLGGSIGYDIPIYYENTEITNPIVQTKQVRDHAANGGVGSFFVGYGQYFDLFYVGGELFGDIYSAKDKSYANQTVGGINITTSTQRDLRYSYGVSLIPGIQLNKRTLFYGRLGYVNGHFTSNSVKSNTILGQLPVNYFSTNLNGVDYGAGIEVLLQRNLSLRGEFKHSHYFGKVIVDPGANFYPTNNMITLGLSYKF